MSHSDQDPWGKPGSSSNGQGRNDQGNPQGNHGKDQQNPPDLEEIFNNLLKKITPNKGSNSNKGNSPQKSVDLPWKKLVPAVAIIGTVLWAASGFYTIKEADRGVVLRFGKLDHIVQPGLNWKPTFIDTVIPVNVEQVKELRTSGSMLTRDENMVIVEMTVQYRVAEPAKYLFSVTNANDSLSQATDSALRYVIGNMNMDEILTTGRSVVRERTWKAIEQIIKPYDMGVQILDVNFQSARPPEEVKAAFDDAIKAQEDEQRYIREAEAYAREKEPIARGNARRMVESANAYKQQVVLNAQGEVERYLRLLPEYQADPKLLRERIYLQTMQGVMENTPKVITDGNSNNLNVLPLDKLLQTEPVQPAPEQKVSPAMKAPAPQPSTPRVSENRTQTSDIYTERKGRFN